jgi:hypothetical protein
VPLYACRLYPLPVEERPTEKQSEPWWIRVGLYSGAAYGFLIYNVATSGSDTAIVQLALLATLLIWWLVEVVRWRREHRR